MVEVIEGIEPYSVKHLPIVRAYGEKIGLVDLVNTLVPSEMDVAPGYFFLGMVLDTLSGRSPLYRLESFFEDQDTELLLGKPVKAKSFNDENVARFLDKVYEVGTMKLFTEIAQRSVSTFGVDCRHVHFDTTSRSVYGDYDIYGKDAPFDITYGYSKDHRPDLKQFLISLLCVDGTVPIFGKTEDGNASDKKVNNAILTDISKYMAKHGLGPNAYIYIADSAMVTKDNLKRIGDDIFFISRLPATYKECRRVIEEAVAGKAWEDVGVLAVTKPTNKRPAAYYKASESHVTIYGKQYRAVVVHSSAHDKRRQKRIERELKNERKRVLGLCKKERKTEYFCRADAEAAAQRVGAIKSKYYTIHARIEERPQYGRGRPRNDEAREVKKMHYGIYAQINENEAAVSTFREEAGCFALITNVPPDSHADIGDYDARSVLQAYKEQHGIEQDFGFLKDPTIVNSIFLKKPERIEVLGLILLTALLIWRLMEKTMRRHVADSGEKLSGWDQKPTDRPTSFMMTTKFTGIIVMKIGNERKLSKPFTAVQEAFLKALQVSPEVFVNPRAG